MQLKAENRKLRDHIELKLDKEDVNEMMTERLGSSEERFVLALKKLCNQQIDQSTHDFLQSLACSLNGE